MIEVDWFAILKPMLPFLAVVIALRLLISWLKSSRGKGKLGEGLVSYRLRKGLPAEVYRIVDDVYLPLDDGSTTEYIRSFGEQVFKDSEVDDIESAIREWNASVTPEQRRSHVKNLIRRHEKGGNQGNSIRK